MTSKEFYQKFINYLINAGYSEREIASKSGISPSTINRAKDGITKLGTSNQNLLDKVFAAEKTQFEKQAGIETTPDPKDKIIAEMREKFALSKELTDVLREKVFAMKDKMDLLEVENERLKEELKRLKGE